MMTFAGDRLPLQNALQREAVQPKSPGDPERLGTYDTLRFLQRTVGNRRVMRMLEMNPIPAHAENRFEQEADGVADKLSLMPQHSQEEGQSVVSRQGAESITLLRQENLHNIPHGRPGSQTEFSAESSPETFSSPDLNRLTMSGTGEPLLDPTRAFFESYFGHDFRDVRIHHGTEAARLAKNLYARAFTVGRDVVFGKGHYPPTDREGRRLLAHELTHVVQQHSCTPVGAGVFVQCDNEGGEGDEVTEPAEQRRRFVEAFEDNPQAAVASIANILEIGAGRFEVYGLIYIDTRTGELQFVRRKAQRIQLIEAEMRMLRTRGITRPATELGQLRSLLQQLADMGKEDIQQRIENWFDDPDEALRTLNRVEAELRAGHAGYPAVTDDQIEQISDVLDAFSVSKSFVIPREERPRPAGKVLLGYFHSHPQLSPPSGLVGAPSWSGDIPLAEQQGEGSFMITGTPANPRVFFIAEGRYWDLGNVLQSAIDRQAGFIAGYDQALGGLFLRQFLGSHGFLAELRTGERPGLRISQGFTLGGYRLRLEGAVNPALSSLELAREGPETAHLIQASTLGGGLEFNFSEQPYIPGSLSLEYLGAGLFRVRGKISPWPLPGFGVTLAGGASLFEGRAGIDAEGFFEIEAGGVPVPFIGGGLGLNARFLFPSREGRFNLFYENPWFRVDYTLSQAAGGELTHHGVTGTIDYRLPKGFLQLQIGYQETVFGSIGYRLHLP